MVLPSLDRHWSKTDPRRVRKASRGLPEEIPRRLIQMFSIEGDLVLDPFLGSGTSLKAAMDLNRRFVGYEKLEDFSRIIRERMGQESGRVLFQTQSVVEQISSALTV